MGSFSATIHGWHPASVNRLYSGHWTKRRKLKKADAETILYSLSAVVPRATGRRLLNVTFHGLRADVDNCLKSLLDGLVGAGLLRDDCPRWLELGKLKAESGKKATTIELIDIPEAQHST